MDNLDVAVILLGLLTVGFLIGLIYIIGVLAGGWS